MNVNIKLTQNYKKYIFDNFEIWLSGFIFSNNTVVSERDLAKFIVENIDFEKNKENSMFLNGFFSFCYKDKNKVVIGVDHLRTKALFYKLNDNELVISDAADNLLDDNLIEKISTNALSEFKATGYVFGNSTFFDEIKYTTGGSFFYFDLNTGSTSEQLFFDFHQHRKGYMWENLKNEYDIIVDNIFDRFISYANGRQIVVPLSAGHDSLLIVSALKNKGYENVITFTYGEKNNKEALISKRVAETLGFQWVFIEYTKEKWIKEWTDSAIKDFSSYTMNLHCLPHIQDYIAVKEMKEKGIVEEDAIFTPGHCPAGVHFPKFVFYRKEFSKEDLIKFILDYHFVNDMKEVRSNMKVFIRYLDSFCDKHHFTGSVDSFANLVELWQWYEREPKYIVNSVRNYTYFGYDYALPLWDVEHAIFWRDMSFSISGDRRWYEWYIENYYKQLIGEKEFKDFEPLKEYPKEVCFKDTVLGKFLKRLRYFFLTKDHPLLFSSIYGRYNYFVEVVIKGNHILNKYAHSFLRVVLGQN